jgi:hypothetical protein
MRWRHVRDVIAARSGPLLVHQPMSCPPAREHTLSLLLLGCRGPAVGVPAVLREGVQAVPPGNLRAQRGMLRLALASRSGLVGVCALESLWHVSLVGASTCCFDAHSWLRACLSPLVPSAPCSRTIESVVHARMRAPSACTRLSGAERHRPDIRCCLQVVSDRCGGSDENESTGARTISAPQRDPLVSACLPCLPCLA